MTFGTLKDNESNKFRGTVALPKVAVTIEDGLLSGVTYTKIEITYPTALTEVYNYYNGATLSAQVMLTYTNSSKQNLSIAERL